MTNSYLFGLPGSSAVKNLPAVQEMRVQSLDVEGPVIPENPMPGESHAQRSMVGLYSPWVHKRFSHNLVTKQQQLSVWYY